MTDQAEQSATSAPGRTVIFAGGGSGGHLYPGIAVAQHLVRLRPEVRPLFLCTKREIDRVVLEPTGFEFIEQPIVPPRRSVGGLLRFWQSWRATNDLVKRILDERKPAAILGLGGYAAGVAVKLSDRRSHKAPAAILNPDVIPGKANLYLMRFCRRVYCGFEQTLEHVPGEYRDLCRVVGCPLRAEFDELPTSDASCERLGLDPRLNTLVVTGASQGARTVNEAVVEVVARMARDGKASASAKEPIRPPLQGWQVLHLAGREHAADVRAQWRDTGINGRAKVVDFTAEMTDVWAAADLAVSRAGASSCAELLTCGVPSVLMPYPFHKDMHQRANAQALADAGAAVILDDKRARNANADALRPVLESLLYDATRRREMSDAARAAAKPDAAADVAADLAGMLDSP